MIREVEVTLTDVDEVSGQFRYAWKQVMPDAVTGDDVDPLSGLIGDVDVNYAIERDNLEVAVGSRVLVRQYGTVADQTIWVFSAPSPTGAVTGTGTANKLAVWSNVAGVVHSIYASDITFNGSGSLSSTGTFFVGQYVGNHILGSGLEYAAFIVNDASAGNCISMGRVVVPGMGGTILPGLQQGVTGIQLAFDATGGSLQRVILGTRTAIGVPGLRYSTTDSSGVIWDGAYGTDTIGNVFKGGLCVTVGATAVVSLSAANTWTNTQTINSGANVPAISIQQTSSDASNTLIVRNIAGSMTLSVTGAGDVTANSFTGAGSGLTGLSASALASGIVPDARIGSATRAGIAALAASYGYLN